MSIKSDVRILGIDDAPFTFEKRGEKMPLVGVLMRGKNYVESVMVDAITCDGDDATDTIKKMILASHYKEQIYAVMIDGAAVGGFNVIDIDDLYDAIRKPVLTITRKKPDFDAIKKALKAHFDSWEQRFGVLTRGELTMIETAHNPLYVSYVGAKKEKVAELIQRSTKIGAVPEPIRVAHLIATAIVRKESHGRA